MNKYDHTMKTIVCDVDNVVVESGKQFVEWLLTYDPFVDACDKLDIDPYHHAGTMYNPTIGLGLSDGCIREILGWWSSDDLYDYARPMERSVEVLEELSLRYNIVFASHVEGDHGKSKVNFLKKYFPFMTGYAATRQKNIIHSDYSIDDRVEHLMQLRVNTTPLLFKSQWGNVDHRFEIVDWDNMLSKITI